MSNVILAIFCMQPPFAEVLSRELLLNGLSFSPFRGRPGSFSPSFRLWIPKTVQRSALYRSRREFSNEILIPTSIYLQKSASIQPRTSPSKFGGKYSILFTGVLSKGCGTADVKQEHTWRGSFSAVSTPIFGRTCSWESS